MKYMKVLLLLIVSFQVYAGINQTGLVTGEDFLTYCSGTKYLEKDNIDICGSVLVNALSSADRMMSYTMDHHFGKGTWLCTKRYYYPSEIKLTTLVKITENSLAMNPDVKNDSVYEVFLKGYMRSGKKKCFKHAYVE